MEDNEPQEMHLFIPVHPHPLPSLPLHPSQTIRRHFRKNENIEPPFLWTTSKRATVHTLQYLLSHNLTTITGKVECANCHAQREIEFDLMEKFKKVSDFILKNKLEIYWKIDREPINWMKPAAINCIKCKNGNCMKPVICKKKKGINWLFLFLGEMIGCCDILQLQYFCWHTQGFRYDSKDRLIYLTYVGLCKQLQPEGSFDPPS